MISKHTGLGAALTIISDEASVQSGDMDILYLLTYGCYCGQHYYEPYNDFNHKSQQEYEYQRHTYNIKTYHTCIYNNS